MMSNSNNYVIVDSDLRKIKHNDRSVWTRRGANRVLKNIGNDLLFLMPLDEHNNIMNNTFVEVRSLMSGTMVTIPLADKGTCLDPSTETYWSM